MSNAISETTRRNLFDELRLANVNWAGRLMEDEFLARVFDLSKLPSYDRRCSDMAGDIQLHRHNFSDWGEDWVFDDSRLSLLRCDDEKFLSFLSEMIHPVVRSDATERETLRTIFNQHLSSDGFEIGILKYISGCPVHSGRRRVAGPEPIPAAAHRAADDLDSAHIAAQIARLHGSIDSDPPLAIGTAKEFLETICKGILDARGIGATGTEDLPRLVRMTREALGIEQTAPNGCVRKIMNGLATAMQGLAELRGAFGTGHGPSPAATMASPMVAQLAVRSAMAVGLFFLHTHQHEWASHQRAAQ